MRYSEILMPADFMCNFVILYMALYDTDNSAENTISAIHERRGSLMNCIPLS